MLRIEQSTTRRGLEQDGTRLRFHDLRHTFASHLIVDLNLDVVQVSRILGQASPATTLDIYAHLFDDARLAADIRSRMSRSEFARLLEDDDEGDLIHATRSCQTGGPAFSPRARRDPLDYLTRTRLRAQVAGLNTTRETR